MHLKPLCTYELAGDLVNSDSDSVKSGWEPENLHCQQFQENITSPGSGNTLRNKLVSNEINIL